MRNIFYGFDMGRHYLLLEIRFEDKGNGSYEISVADVTGLENKKYRVKF